jgi:hypothetical protein
MLCIAVQSEEARKRCDVGVRWVGGREGAEGGIKRNAGRWRNAICSRSAARSRANPGAIVDLVCVLLDSNALLQTSTASGGVAISDYCEAVTSLIRAVLRCGEGRVPSSMGRESGVAGGEGAEHGVQGAAGASAGKQPAQAPHVLGLAFASLAMSRSRWMR